MALADVQDAVKEITDVLDFGDKKHGRADWKNNPQRWSVHIRAIFRHLVRWWLYRVDESGKSHLAHALSRGVILLQMELDNVGDDDRKQVGYHYTFYEESRKALE